MISNLQNNHRLINNDGVEYYTIEGMEHVHTEMLRLLMIIDSVAKENGISYWIAGGSMIGVLRHHGFIPWDDDLDIELLKPDYIKLIKCLSEFCSSHNNEFLFYDYPQNYHCCNYFASRNVFVRTQGSANVCPVKVDIRPYNCIKATDKDIQENNKYKDIANYKIYGKTYGYVEKKEADLLDSTTFFDFYNNKYGLYSPTADDCLLVPPYFEYSISFNFKYSNLFPLKTDFFEGCCVPVPKDSDYILSSIYGDYMQLPKLEHRVPVSCEVYKKHLSLHVVKSHFCTHNNNRLHIWIKQLMFLLRFHSLVNIIKYRFIENKITTGSDYEKSKNEW